MRSVSRVLVAVFLALSGICNGRAQAQACHPTITHSISNGYHHFHAQGNSAPPCDVVLYKWGFFDSAGNCLEGNDDTRGCPFNGFPSGPGTDRDFSACHAPGQYLFTYIPNCSHFDGNSCANDGTAEADYPFTIPPLSAQVTSHITGDKVRVTYDYAGAASPSMSYTIDSGTPVNVTDAACLQPSGTCTLTLGIPCGDGVNHNLALSVTGCSTHTTNQTFKVECTDAECGPRTTCRVCPGKPVNVGSGDVAATVPLFSIGEPVRPLDFALTYHSVSRKYESLIDRPLGLGWSHTFNMSMRPVNANRLQFVTPDGSTYFFDKTGSSTWQASRPATLTDYVVLASGQYLLTTLAGEQATFNASTGRWLSSTDRWGNTVTAGYDMSGKLSTITDAVGRVITLSYSGGYLSQLALWDGSTWQFSISGGELATVSDPPHGGAAWELFTYAPDHNGVPRLLSAVTDDNGAILEGHGYDTTNDVGITSFVEGNRDSITVQYDTPSPGQSVVTETRGSISEVTTYTLDFIGGVYVPRVIVGICSACGSTNDSETYVHDALGHVLAQSDGLGHTTLFSYDSNGNISTKTEAAGTPHERLTTYQYTYSSDPTFTTEAAVPSVISGASKKVDRSYNAGTPFEHVLTTSVTGRLLPASPPTTATFTSTVTFDGRHRITQQHGPRTDVTAVSSLLYYSDSDSVLNRRGRLQTATDAVGLTTTFDDYDAFGTPRTVTDPNGVVTTRVTDGRGRVTSETSHAVAGDSNESSDYTRTFTYDTRDRLTQTTNPRGFMTQYGYESGTNSLIDTIRVDGSGNQIERHHLTLDASGHVTTDEDQSCDTPASSCSNWTTMRTVSSVYDAKGRLSETDQPVPAGAKVLYAYDPDGKLASVQDENHTAPNTIYAYDELERLTTVTQTLSGAAGGSIATGYAYNVQDNLTTVTDPNSNQTTYAYDDFGRLQSQVSPVTGTTTYAYDEAANLITATDANQAVTTRTYDALNRVLTAVSSCAGQSNETVTWTYDDTSSGNYGRGRIASMTDPAGSTQYAYERRGMPRSEARTSSTGTYATTYGYDSDGNRSKIGYPSGLTVNYTLDFADRPFTAASAAATFVSHASYLPFGPSRGITIPRSSGTFFSTLGYDMRYLPTVRGFYTLAGDSVTPIANYSYSHDAKGNITKLQEGVTGTNRTFTYDDLSRLTSATTDSSLWGTMAYSYDAMGNMLQRSISRSVADENGGPPSAFVAASRSFTYLPNAAGQNLAKLQTVTENGLDHSVAYDNAGNETAYIMSRTYSPRNFLSSVQDSWEVTPTHKIAYAYDGRGIRVQKVENPTGYMQPTATRDYIYSPELQLLSVSRPNNPTIYGKRAVVNDVLNAQYDIIWFGGIPVAHIDYDSGTTRSTFTDHLGTPIIQLNADGSTFWQPEFEPFGDIWQMRVGNPADQPLRFPGQERTIAWEGTEEDYNIFRWYRAGWGRYSQADPLGLEAGVNVYRYAYANPLSLADPTGLQSNPIETIICCELRSKINDAVTTLARRYVEEERMQRIISEHVIDRTTFENLRQYLGHRQAYKQRQTNLNKLLKRWDDNNCGPPPSSVGDWATRPYPGIGYVYDAWWDTQVRNEQDFRWWLGGYNLCGCH